MSHTPCLSWDSRFPTFHLHLADPPQVLRPWGGDKTLKIWGISPQNSFMEQQRANLRADLSPLDPRNLFHSPNTQQPQNPTAPKPNSPSSPQGNIPKENSSFEFPLAPWRCLVCCPAPEHPHPATVSPGPGQPCLAAASH